MEDNSETFSDYFSSLPDEVEELLIEESEIVEEAPEEVVEVAEEVVAEDKPKKTRKSSARKKAVPNDKVVNSDVAVYSSGKLSHPSLGRLAKGYTVMSSDKANEWMNISKKVRLATPEEVAAAYEV